MAGDTVGSRRADLAPYDVVRHLASPGDDASQAVAKASSEGAIVEDGDHAP
ncbi:MAG TPA: hypothetical protein VN635_06420 [Conexibacter sp.]|nr:hypothetical protein [Conexibacter sp.]